MLITWFGGCERYADIVDDDPTIDIIDPEPVFDGGTAEFQIVMSQAVDHNVTVYYHTQNKTALAGKIWKGNKLLLEYEQSVTLQQGIYDKFPETFFRVTQYGQLAGMMVSPIPGDKS